MTSETPMTDRKAEYAARLNSFSAKLELMTDHGRQLERELSALKAEVEGMRKAGEILEGALTIWYRDHAHRCSLCKEMTEKAFNDAHAAIAEGKL